jgi:hypothetical protein
MRAMRKLAFVALLLALAGLAVALWHMGAGYPP